MASSPDSASMALFCDFENVALGVRDAQFEKFDIKPVLEKLLLKGSIVVKKAYCDWDRYKSFKATMHEANFELIEIPHVRQSGKNSADIRLVVDALDLCYTKSHVDTFVIISGDSDFSPLVSKLRENAKKVIGVGVKQSTSDLLVANCDEFIFYDDLVREQQRTIAKRDAREGNAAGRRGADEDKQPKHELEARRAKAVAIAVETFEALAAERGESGKIWASVLKSAIKRRKPDFNESYYGFRAFGNLLDEAQARGLLEVGRDDKSGAFVYRSSRAPVAAHVRSSDAPTVAKAAESMAESGGDVGERPARGARKRRDRQAPAVAAAAEAAAQDASSPDASAAVIHEAVREHDAPAKAAADANAEADVKPAPAPRRARKTAAKKSRAAVDTAAVVAQTPPEESAVGEPATDAAFPAAPPAAPAKAARKSTSRGGRARKASVDDSGR